jgi:hypothetical protein
VSQCPKVSHTLFGSKVKNRDSSPRRKLFPEQSREASPSGNKRRRRAPCVSQPLHSLREPRVESFKPLAPKKVDLGLDWISVTETASRSNQLSRKSQVLGFGERVSGAGITHNL